MAKPLSNKEIRNKSRAEVGKLVADLELELQHLRFKLAARDLKDVRSLRSVRTTLARLKTYLRASS